MAEAGLLAGLELVVRLVLVLVHVLQEVRSQGRRGWMRKIGVDHNKVDDDICPDIPPICRWHKPGRLDPQTAGCHYSTASNLEQGLQREYQEWPEKGQVSCRAGLRCS